MPNRSLSWWEVASVLSTVSKKELIIAWNWEQLITRWEVSKLIVDAFWFRNSESWATKTKLSMSNWWDQILDSSSKNALSSLWTDFQNLMKIS
jgi:hypothetical protein